MPKSTGNYVSLESLLRDQPPKAIRRLPLQPHSRRPIDFSPEHMAEATTAWRRLSGARRRLHETAGDAEPKAQEPVARDRFVEAMDDDLNTAEAVAGLFELARQANAALDQ